MKNVNEILLIGYVGQDPESKQVGESLLVSFSLATTKTWKNKQGEEKKETQWHNCQIWGKLAEIAQKYVKKGDPLMLRGEIKYSSTGDGDSKKYFTNIVVNDINMLGTKPEQGASQNYPPVVNNDTQSHSAPVEDGDDLPF